MRVGGRWGEILLPVVVDRASPHRGNNLHVQYFTIPRSFSLKADAARFVDTKSLSNVPGLIP